MQKKIVKFITINQCINYRYFTDILIMETQSVLIPAHHVLTFWYAPIAFGIASQRQKPPLQRLAPHVSRHDTHGLRFFG